ncbi:hypothetical protein BRADI_1g10525v3 [Brachypodium distachyon]|uniref:Uncharacterized protein n=1 Tax=Brachypodium distachyon TaxID=15368 RepID=A0A2K2DIW3_BRADI|nr:hypothetical protein BRADI_1g10525v3 [Brachypodium distachyon]
MQKRTHATYITKIRLKHMFKPQEVCSDCNISLMCPLQMTDMLKAYRNNLRIIKNLTSSSLPSSIIEAHDFTNNSDSRTMNLACSELDKVTMKKYENK